MPDIVMIDEPRRDRMPYKTIGGIPLDKLVYVADNLYFVVGDVYKVDAETGKAKHLSLIHI